MGIFPALSGKKYLSEKMVYMVIFVGERRLRKRLLLVLCERVGCPLEYSGILKISAHPLNKAKSMTQAHKCGKKTLEAFETSKTPSHKVVECDVKVYLSCTHRNLTTDGD